MTKCTCWHLLPQAPRGKRHWEHLLKTWAKMKQNRGGSVVIDETPFKKKRIKVLLPKSGSSCVIWWDLQGLFQTRWAWKDRCSANVCFFIVAARQYFYCLASMDPIKLLSRPQAAEQEFHLWLHSGTEGIIGPFVLLSCVSSRMWEVQQLCLAALLDLSHEVKEGGCEGAARLMWVTCVSFSLFFTEDPGQSVEPEGVRVFAQQTESGGNKKGIESQKKKSVWRRSRQPEGTKDPDSQCFPRTMGADDREGETFLSVLPSPVLSFVLSAGTAVSFSYHMALRLQPGMCWVLSQQPLRRIRNIFSHLIPRLHNNSLKHISEETSEIGM